MSQSEPRVYHPLSPSPEAGRAILAYAVGGALGMGLLVVLAKRAHDSSLQAAFLGAGLAIIWGVFRAWREWRDLHQFARHAALALGPDELHFTDPRGQEVLIPWKELKGEMNGGRLQLSWPTGQLLVGSREWEDGMNLTRLLANRLAPHRPTNFIPLEALSRPRSTPLPMVTEGDDPQESA